MFLNFFEDGRLLNFRFFLSLTVLLENLTLRRTYTRRAEYLRYLVILIW
jgi:hypothetical protein